jgi:pantetheine-phosphate adenylyltransferase
MSKTIIYPGSFDPVTYGHIDIAKRLSKTFTNVIIAVGVNFEKNNYLLSLDERVELFKQNIPNLNNVKVLRMDGLLVDFCKKHNASIIIRGVRNKQEFIYQNKFAKIYKEQYNGKEEVLLITSNYEYKKVSSSLVKEKLIKNKNISNLTPYKI